jgi:hypothetical protein
MVFASNISDPKDRLTLERFCAERGIRDPDTGVPIQLETFTEYGLTFKARILPHLIATIKDFIENETPSRK